VPLLLLDLDNTLIDRAASFRAVAREVLYRIGAPADDLEWLLKVDDDGHASRWEVAEAIRDRYGLSISTLDLIDALHDGVVGYSRLDPMVACAVKIAGQAGWVPVVVCNGGMRQQEAKIRMTGLDRYLADWVISEEVGIRKPDPRIFEVAADRARMPVRGAWMIGDSPASDIAGAKALGIRSVWLHRGRKWTERHYAPTVTADNPIAALAAVMYHTGTRDPRQYRPLVRERYMPRETFTGAYARVG
jgi:putative hydrolase of the HAD superfamily